METAVENMELVKLDIEDRYGRTYTLRFTGVALAEIRQGMVYRTDEDQFVAYDMRRSEATVVDDAEELWDLLDRDDYIGVMNALGITPEIDL